jgi:methylmalonyl-CoA mutase N-terminal domain/subunit
MEAEAMAIIDEIDRRGGMVAAIEAGWPQRTIADSAYAFQQAVESGERTIVGVNQHADGQAEPVPTLSIDDRTAVEQAARVAAVRARRDPDRAVRALAALEAAARTDANLMPVLVEGARARATLGEMTGVLRRVWGEHEEAPEV